MQPHPPAVSLPRREVRRGQPVTPRWVVVGDGVGASCDAPTVTVRVAEAVAYFPLSPQKPSDTTTTCCPSRTVIASAGFAVCHRHEGGGRSAIGVTSSRVGPAEVATAHRHVVQRNAGVGYFVVAFRTRPENVALALMVLPTTETCGSTVK